MELGKLVDLKPQSVFSYFEKICSIPHGSKNVDQISDYLVGFAKEHELKYIQDEYKNVIIFKEASEGYSNDPAIILQGHMDMVAVKTEDCKKNLDTEGLDLLVEGDFLTADKTSLGGDDGIAVAYSLAILADDTIKHPRLEVIFTVDEEVGMDGARDIDLSMLTGKRMINIDSEEEGFLLAGCAGGGTITSELPIKLESKKGQVVELKISNLLGGHSGVEIDKVRGNAIYMLTRLIRMIGMEIPISIVEISGGEKDNAIPNRASAKVMIAEEKMDFFMKEFDKYSGILNKEYQAKEPNICINAKRLTVEECSVLDSDSYERLMQLSLYMPDGVQEMSASIRGLVETSLNTGIMNFNKEYIEFITSVRSSFTSAKMELVAKVEGLVRLFGGTSRLEGAYPAWEYLEDSKLRDSMTSLYKEIYGKEMEVLIIHAGLECGLISEKIPGLDCVSIGPDMEDIHTPNEKLSISSTERVWDFLLKFLAMKA